MRHLLLIRGLPGSGKSTLAQSLYDYVHFESDMYHIKDGVYNWQSENVKASHEWCQDKVLLSMHRHVPKIVVSNTFSRIWEMLPYMDLAKERNYSLQVITCHSQWESIHPVPKQTIQKMKDRWEEWPKKEE